MLHGIRLHAYVWSDFSRRFCHEYHVVSLDHRGHGDSDWASGAYNLETYYQDVRQVLESKELDQVTLIGHSLGARVALHYAAQHPEQVRALVLVDPRTRFGKEQLGRDPTRDLSRDTETAPPKDFASHDEAIEYLSKIMWRAPRELIEESVRTGMREAAPGRFTWKYDPTLGGIPGPRAGDPLAEYLEAASRVRCPALLLYGEHSQVSSPEVLKRMAGVMPAARVECIREAGHALFSDQPQTFAESVGAFLSTAARQPIRQGSS
jgi:pimeloyl-ACP methyl ester carboxylesterase